MQSSHSSLDRTQQYMYTQEKNALPFELIIKSGKC